ncbi:hypothetical protein [Candidatus Nitrospira bockiana]
MKTSPLLMIIAVALLLSLPACARHYGYGHHRDSRTSMERGMKEMSDLIDRTVKDPAKAQQVKALTKQIADEASASIRERREAHRKLYDLNENYHASPEEFMKILDDSHNNSMRSASKILNLRFQIKDLLTPDEWKALTDDMRTYANRYSDGEREYR